MMTSELEDVVTFLSICGDCAWTYNIDDMQGQVIKHSLDSWDKIKNFKPPNPEEGLPVEGDRSISWNKVEESVKN